MQDNMARWVDEIEKRGLLDKSDPENQDWMSVDGLDGSILQVRRGTTYIRIVWNADRPLEFQFSRYASTEHPRYPKTEFHIKPYEPQVLSAQGVERELFV